MIMNPEFVKKEISRRQRNKLPKAPMKPISNTSTLKSTKSLNLPSIVAKPPSPIAPEKKLETGTKESIDFSGAAEFIKANQEESTKLTGRSNTQTSRDIELEMWALSSDSYSNLEH